MANVCVRATVLAVLAAAVTVLPRAIAQRVRIASARRLLPVTLVLSGALMFSACGDDDSKDGAASKAQPQPLAVEVIKEGENKYRMTASQSVAAGLVEISFTAPAGRGTHDAQLVRVEGEHEVEEVLKYLGSEGAPAPEWLFAAGGVGQTAGGATTKTTQELMPGSYYILDTDEPEGDNVKSYAERGATTALEVTGEASGGELPEADAKITAKDYSFASSALKAGKNTVAFDNVGKEPHHVIAFPYAAGADFADVKTFFSQEGPPKGRPPVDFAGATRTAALEGGTKQVTELDLKRGKYAFICFISDRKGGPPHLAKGQIVEATVE